MKYALFLFNAASMALCVGVSTNTLISGHPTPMAAVDFALAVLVLPAVIACAVAVGRDMR